MEMSGVMERWRGQDERSGGRRHRSMIDHACMGADHSMTPFLHHANITQVAAEPWRFSRAGSVDQLGFSSPGSARAIFRLRRR